jgi:hypothetical protein
MVAVRLDAISKIETAQKAVEPMIMDIIRSSNETNCPFRVLNQGKPESSETKGVITAVARMLYKNNLLDKLDLSLSNEESYDTLIYAFRYWGGNTLNKHGNEICTCKDRCY